MSHAETLRESQVQLYATQTQSPWVGEFRIVTLQVVKTQRHAGLAGHWSSDRSGSHIWLSRGGNSYDFIAIVTIIISAIIATIIIVLISLLRNVDLQLMTASEPIWTNIRTSTSV